MGTPADERGARGRVVVVGAGITGLAAAHRVLTSDPEVAVTVLESSDVVGGKIRTTPFAGLPAVDEGPDAYLARLPAAVGLARELGLEEAVTHPATGAAAVWHDGLRRIPEGLVLGVPTGVLPLLRSGLLSTRGALRAGLEPFLPRSPVDDDCIGTWVRARFGDEVHELLLDPLVGSIYAADTDRFSLSTVPQLAALAQHRSVLLGARRQRAGAPAPGASPVFETPVAGMGHLVSVLTGTIECLGGEIRTSRPVGELDRQGQRYLVDGEPADGVILACPAAPAAGLLRTLGPALSDVAAALDVVEVASVVIVTVSVPPEQWARTGVGRELSGYLVPKPDQRHVTAVSFASNKWAHWRPEDGSMVLRISLGRDGLVVDHHDDEWLVATALNETSEHLDTALAPSEVRLTRWPGAFPQYRPGHLSRLAEMERTLAVAAPGVRLAGASHRGMGIPACIQQGREAAAASLIFLTSVRE